MFLASKLINLWLFDKIKLISPNSDLYNMNVHNNSAKYTLKCHYFWIKYFPTWLPCLNFPRDRKQTIIFVWPNESWAFNWVEHMLYQVFLKTVERAHIADMLGYWVPYFSSSSWKRFVVCSANVKHFFTYRSSTMCMNFGQGCEEI